MSQQNPPVWALYIITVVFLLNKDEHIIRKSARKRRARGHPGPFDRSVGRTKSGSTIYRSCLQILLMCVPGASRGIVLVGSHSSLSDRVNPICFIALKAASSHCGQRALQMQKEELLQGILQHAGSSCSHGRNRSRQGEVATGRSHEQGSHKSASPSLASAAMYQNGFFVLQTLNQRQHHLLQINLRVPRNPLVAKLAIVPVHTCKRGEAVC